MEKSLLSVLRKNTKLLNSIIFFTCWSQVHAYANSTYLNRHENVTPIMEINDASKNNIKKDISEGITAEEKKDISKEPDGISGSKEKSGPTILVSPAKTIKYNTSAPLSLNEKRYYTSDIKEGIIGTSSEHPIDQIYDNIFNISVDEKINSAYQYTLEYDLYGVDSYK
ncbi:MAG: hypothetical protein L0G05_10345, partial [Chryseobacterium sp.]|nr:hypothetical protein [Chryseobacterium sp.]